MSMIPVSELNLRVGDRLDFPVCDRSGQMLLQKGKVVGSSSVLARLQERGFMRIGEDVAPPRKGDAELAIEAAEGPAAAAKTAQGKLLILAEHLARVMKRIVNPTPGAVSADVRTLAGWANGIYLRDPDQLIGIQQMIGAGEESIEGAALHGAILVRLIAAAEGLTAEAQISLMCAALTRHVALAGEEGGRRVREVGIESANLLRQCEVTDPVWLNAVAHHQARLDGTGLPAGLSPEQISMGARILGVVDAYVEATRPGADTSAKQPREALKAMYAGEASRLEPKIITALIRQLGIYPPGSVLRLASGEIAVSTRRTGDAKRPIVRAAIAVDGLPYAAPPLRDTQIANTRILEVLDIAKYRGLISMAPGLWRRDLDLIEEVESTAVDVETAVSSA